MVAHLEETVTEPRAASACLETLAELLCAAGLYARVNLPIGRPPSLHVLNPAAPGLEEHVIIERCHRDEWWLRWDWAEEIAPADDLGRAVDTIRRVLGVSA